MRKLFAVLIVFAASSLSINAQDVSDAQFKKFAVAFEAVQKDNNKAQLEMVEMIEAEGLTAQRFNEIHMASLNANQESDASASEKKKHQAILGKLEERNVVLQAAMESKIKEAGLTVEEYQQIFQKIQSDPAMQERFKAYFSSKSN